jgi:nitrate reductase assembly molybdenum cofactor insertion protein NarJ
MMSPAEYPNRIWFNPAKFWAATRDMRPEAAAELLDRIIDLAESQDLEELRNFDFVSFGNPWRKVA